MKSSSHDFQKNHEQSLQQSKPISLESILLSDQEDDSTQAITDNITLFTHSTAWCVINSHLLNPRVCFGNFERGTFNLYDSVANENAKFARPYLPQELRIFIKNMRVINFSCHDIMPRCLHFPLQKDELKILLAILSNLNLNNSYSKIYKNKLIFLMRMAGRLMEGRLSFDASRILKDVINNGFTIKNDDVGIFSVPTDHPVEIDKKMTIRSIPLSKKLDNTRSIALNNRIFAIASSKAINVIDTEHQKNIIFNLEKIQKVCSVPNGNFLTCTKNGFIHEIIMTSDFDNLTMHQVTHINDTIGEFKISYGGERNYAISNIDKTRIYSGIQREYYKVELKEPFVDYEVNNDDIYIATENSVEYYQWGKQYATWNSPAQIRSISIDDMASSICCCTKNGCYIIDPRSPHINSLGTQNISNVVSLHMSPFLDLAVAITENGMITFDMRQPENTLSHVTISRLQSSSTLSPLNSPVHSPSPVHERFDIKGMWMPETRLFPVVFNDSFNITCPYLKMPILESYKIPDDKVVSIHSNLQLSIIHHENLITFIGGFEYPFHVPSVL